MSFGRYSFGARTLGTSWDQTFQSAAVRLAPARVTFKGLPPVVSQTDNHSVALAAARLAFVGHAPSVMQGVSAMAEPVHTVVRIAGQAPAVTQTANHAAAVQNTAIRFVGNAPSVAVVPTAPAKPAPVLSYNPVIRIGDHYNDAEKKYEIPIKAEDRTEAEEEEIILALLMEIATHAVV